MVRSRRSICFFLNKIPQHWISSYHLIYLIVLIIKNNEHGLVLVSVWMFCVCVCVCFNTVDLMMKMTRFLLQLKRFSRLVQTNKQNKTIYLKRIETTNIMCWLCDAKFRKVKDSVASSRFSEKFTVQNIGTHNMSLILLFLYLLFNLFLPALSHTLRWQFRAIRFIHSSFDKSAMHKDEFEHFISSSSRWRWLWCRQNLIAFMVFVSINEEWEHKRNIEYIIICGNEYAFFYCVQLCVQMKTSSALISLYWDRQRIPRKYVK